MDIRSSRRKFPVVSSSTTSPKSFVFSVVTLAILLFLSLAVQYAEAKSDDQARNEQQQQQQDDKNIFVHKTVIIPHDSKKHRGGEDAAATSDNILVVADGVGGWARHNINPGLYSRLLTQTIVDLHDNKHPEEYQNATSMIELVHRANWMAASEHLGSATCTVVKLGLDGSTLQTLNVGDSGYSIHRYSNDDDDEDGPPKLQVVFSSEPGQKRFNFPHQLGGQYGDSVKEVAVEATHDLEPNDIIVVYSDGVSDNLNPREYHECIQRGSAPSLQNDEAPSSSSSSFVILSYSWVADCIAKTAYALGKSKTYLSPFAKGARESGYRHDYIGGKHDDITVVVAQVVASSHAQAASVKNNDPYFEESIYLYTGPVESKDAMPKLTVDSKGGATPKRPVAVGEEL